MPDTQIMLAFIAAALVVLLVPGPGVLYIVARTVSQGRGAGLVSVLGLSAGAAVHVAAATAGLSALLLASATAFELIKVLGAVYLIYLGVRTLLGDGDRPDTPRMSACSWRQLFIDGVVISVLNPKLALFFMAFLPQFVAADGLPPTVQIAALGLIYVLLALITDGAYALLANRIRTLIVAAKPIWHWPRYAGGAIYIGMGVSTLLVERTGSKTA